MLLKENMCTESQLLYKSYFSLNGVLFYFLMQRSPFVFAAEHSSHLFAQLTAQVFLALANLWNASRAR